MIRTASQQDGDGRHRYDACIVGAGPAGITLALELGQRGCRVCLLEAGSEGYSDAAQRLLDGEVMGSPYPPLRRARLSALGGTSRVWAGWCRPLDVEDFEPRPAFGAVGWPFDLQSLTPYYRRAHVICGLSDFEYDPALWRSRFGFGPPLVPEQDLVECMFHVRALNFGTAHRARLEAQRALDVLLGAPVTGLDIDEDGRALGALVRLRTGKTIVIRAGAFVLAAGGIENARLLLLSAADPSRAPGNGHGLVGRFFADHAFVNPGWLVLHGEPRRLDFFFPSPAVGAGAAVRAALALPTDVTEREALPRSALFFHPRYEASSAFDSPAVRTLLELRDMLRSRAVPGAFWPPLMRSLRSPRQIAVAALRRLLVRDGAGMRWRVRMMFETESRRENRLELGDERDVLGRRRPRVHWRLDDGELDAMRRALLRFDAAFRRSGVGHIESRLADDPAAWTAALEGGRHHMGTTRMHADPRQGVVDENCRVHGMRNLYVVGSSVFPSGGFANPTLTIVALAVRLADRLGGETGESLPARIT